MQFLGSIVTPNTITVQFKGEKPVCVMRSEARFADVFKLLKEKQYKRLAEALDLGRKICQVTKGKFIVVDGAIVIDGEPLPNALSERLISMVDQGVDTTALEKFWDNLSLNPSESSRADLFSFLEANHVPLTPDGHFIAYKKVRKDFKDIHSGTFDNSPGRVVSVPRESVDDNRNVTCSRGLHVAAFNYAANNFGSHGDPLLLCKVNPRDVVAVPPDYNEQKMRVCRYEVLDVFTESQPMKDLVKEVASKELEDAKAGVADAPDAQEEEVLQRDKEGRVRVPGRLLRKIGVGANRHVFLHYVADTVILSRDKSKIRLQSREDNSVRLGKSHFTSNGEVTAFLTKNKQIVLLV